MILTLLEIIKAALGIWESKEKTKYSDRILELEKQWYEEYNKPSNTRSNAVLDNVEFELRSTARAIATAIRAKNP